MENRSRRKTKERIETKAKFETSTGKKILSVIAFCIACFCIVQCVILAKYTFGKEVKEESLWLYRALQTEERGK